MSVEIKKLELELEVVNSKITMLISWLTSNVKSDAFVKVCSDKRLLEHKRKELEFIIDNLKKGQPRLGEQIKFMGPT